jgi:hypothetical protein
MRRPQPLVKRWGGRMALTSLLLRCHADVVAGHMLGSGRTRQRLEGLCDGLFAHRAPVTGFADAAA